MLEKLTPEQEKLMIETRDEWINLFFDNVKNQKGIDKVAFEEGIKWVYNDLINKPTPKVIYCDSWEACLISIAIMKRKNSVSYSVWDSVSASVWDSVWDSVRNSVSASVWDSVRDSVSDSVRNSVRDSVWDSVWDSVSASVRDSSNYIGISNYGWISFYDYFEKLNILNNFNFSKYKKLIKSGVFECYEYKDFVFAIQPPIKVNTNSQGRLHSVSEASVKFKDGSSHYFINGVDIKKERFDKLINKKYSFKDFINEKNEEIKATVLVFIEEKFGSQALFDFISKNLSEVDTYIDEKNPELLIGTTGGMNIGVYTLFKGEIEGMNLAYIRCFCPSTDRMFFLSIDSKYNNAKDGIASLYRIPKRLVNEVKYIQRQGERFSTVFTDKGKQILKELNKKEIEDLVTITGEEYFKLMKYEY